MQGRGHSRVKIINQLILMGVVGTMLVTAAFARRVLLQKEMDLRLASRI
jgi:hypothetical protein